MPRCSIEERKCRSRVICEKREFARESVADLFPYRPHATQVRNHGMGWGNKFPQKCYKLELPSLDVATSTTAF